MAEARIGANIGVLPWAWLTWPYCGSILESGPVSPRGQGSRKILRTRKLVREAKERKHVGSIPKEEREYCHQR